MSVVVRNIYFKNISSREQVMKAEAQSWFTVQQTDHQSKLSIKQDVQKALVTANVAWKSDWSARINVTVMDTLIGSKLCLETKAVSDRSLLSQGVPIIDSLTPLLYPW